MNTNSALSLPALITALLLSFVLGAPAVQAAQADQPASTEETGQPAEEKEADASEGASSEVFIPTEEISEDFAVSFPVDI